MYKGGAFNLPKDHEPGLKVPKGGSMCANCKYYAGNNQCGNSNFIVWNQSKVIPEPPDQYCSDWYEPGA